MLLEIPKTAALPASPVISEAEAAAMARAVINLFAKWQITDTEACQILGGLGTRTYARWKKGTPGRIDRDLATRLSLLMGIHKGLRYLFSDPERGYQWIKKPNMTFQDETPLAVMLEGSIFALMRIRSYLDAERGAW